MGERVGLYQPAAEHSACGVGFITRKDGAQTHEVIALGEQALCAIPHRGGMSAEGVGDGAGISIDLSVDFFGALVGQRLERGRFGVGNFFMSDDRTQWGRARGLIDAALAEAGLATLVVRDVPVDDSVLRPRALQYQLPVVQWVFRLADTGGDGDQRDRIDRAANAALRRSRRRRTPTRRWRASIRCRSAPAPRYSRDASTRAR